MAVSAAVAKAATVLASDKRIQKVIGTIIGIIIGIIILIVGVFFTIAHSLSVSSHDIFECIFSKSTSIQFDAPPEYTEEMSGSITNIKASFTKIDHAVELVNERLDQKIDVIWAKAIFYTLYFENPQPDDKFFSAYAECFVITTKIDDTANEIPQTDEKCIV